MLSFKIIDVRVEQGDSAFLLDDGKISILYDTGFGFTGYKIGENIKKILKNRSLDYIFLTHSHYDHALGSAYIKKLYPNVKIVASSYVAYIFTRSGAIATMEKLDRAFAKAKGITDYEFLGNDLTVDIALNDLDKINIGCYEFNALSLPGHTKCSFGYYLEIEKLFLSNESLGVYDGKTTFCPSFLVSVKDSIESIKKVANLDIKYIVAPHYGLLNEDQTKFYLENMLNQAIEEIDVISNQIKDGLTDDEIIEEFKKKYWKDDVKEKYPIDALNLNTSIMINLIKKEILNIK